MLDFPELFLSRNRDFLLVSHPTVHSYTVYTDTPQKIMQHLLYTKAAPIYTVNAC